MATPVWMMLSTLLLLLAASDNAAVLAGQPECTIIKDYGCFVDTLKPRTLPQKADNAYSYKECAANCFSLGFTGTAGAEGGEECWCSNESGPVGGSAPQSECDKTCRDDSTQECGGLSRLSQFSFKCTSGQKFYSCSGGKCVEDPQGPWSHPNCNGQCKAPPPPPTTTTTATPYTTPHPRTTAQPLTCEIVNDYGCFVDTLKPRTLPQKADNAYSYKECAANCFSLGFTGTAGAEGGEECWCSNESGPFSFKCTSGQKFYSCSGGKCVEDPQGPWSHPNCNGQCKAPPPPPTTTTTATPYTTPHPRTTAQPLTCEIVNDYGCFVDTLKPRTLPQKADNAYSYQECAANCYVLGYIGTAGIENGEECWCSSESSSVGDIAPQCRKCVEDPQGPWSDPNCNGACTVPTPFPPPITTTTTSTTPHTTTTVPTNTTTTTTTSTTATTTAPHTPTHAPTPQSLTCEIVNDYGCYVDTLKPRTLPYKTDNAYSLKECAARCYELGHIGTAGVENGEECWCSDASGPVGATAPKSKCDKTCWDDNTQKCGGLSRLSEFSFKCTSGQQFYSCAGGKCVEDPQGPWSDSNCGGACTAPPSPPSPPGPSPPAPPGPSPPSTTPEPLTCKIVNDYGCHVDTKTPRTLPQKAGFASSHQECAANCYRLGFTGTAGVEKGEHCWCSDEFGPVGAAAATSECDRRCQDRPSSQRCGGNSRLSEFAFQCTPGRKFYSCAASYCVEDPHGPWSDPDCGGACKAPSPTPPPPPTTTTTPVPTTPSPPSPSMHCTILMDFGCFKETFTPRTLPHYAGPVKSTVECASACFDLKFNGTAGVENGTQCWCSDTYAPLGPPLPSASCSKRCKGDRAHHCGGPASINEFAFKCSSKQFHYSCSLGRCVADPTGPFITSDCNGKCNAAVAAAPLRSQPRFTCRGRQCVEDADGEYASFNCDHACDPTFLET
ncbi:hypothetical protein PTSG_06784 [Salpingoeca rosetta]|uniref:WSC domain-containing protein n=1 Tax=Salpingoeca rosetta (strain ATCC 50818 / BSB-021) TaxID=946362 RepID=F2UES9_SALR5|nr:uncharacterized protein PTSG_06784 [Salpingoeca rosetta]EGD75129.1 hypothetical protein PTSG_06784 [Salpingoeca rosetta]|eukprot:XP_004992182.1 hypothetical protein PTSG_06784 [Salpingoeca rosetta]